MAFQPINFASIPPQGIPFLRDFMQTLTQGMQAGAMPGQMRREAEQAQLENAFKQQQMKQMQAQQAQQERQQGIRDYVLGGREQSQQGMTQPQTAGMFGQRGQNPSMMEMFKEQLAPMLQPPQPEQPKSPYEDMFKNMSPEQFKGLQNAMRNQDLGFTSGQTPYDVTQEKNAAEIRKNQYETQAAQTKFANEVKLENIKNANKIKAESAKPGKSAEALAPKTIADLQTGVNNISILKPQVKELIKMVEEDKVPGAFTGNFWNRDEMSAYKGKVGGMVDTLVKAMNYLGIEKSIEKAEEQLERQKGESTGAYKIRLENLYKSLEEHEASGRSILKRSTVAEDEPVKDGATY